MPKHARTLSETPPLSTSLKQECWTSAFSRNSVKNMKFLLTVLMLGLGVSFRVDGQTNEASPADASGQTVETLVCIRHGEKPPGGLGQLTPRGLNRALALPKVLLEKYGSPQYVFAPNPAQKVHELKGYNYIRPLMTIEPTAIRCGLPVNTEFGYREIKGLEKELEKPEYKKATIFVAWEHRLLDDFVKDVVKSHDGNPAQVPSWPGTDYDSIFLVKITRSKGHATVAFTVDHEGLNNLNDAWPEPAK
jgi:hypothetical protein